MKTPPICQIHILIAITFEPITQFYFNFFFDRRGILEGKILSEFQLLSFHGVATAVKGNVTKGSFFLVLLVLKLL